MRGLSIVVCSAVVALGGCVEPQPRTQPEPQSASAAPASELPPTSDTRRTPAVAATRPAATDAVRNPTPAAPAQPAQPGDDASAGQPRPGAAAPAASPSVASAAEPPTSARAPVASAAASPTSARAPVASATDSTRPAGAPAAAPTTIAPPAAPSLDLAGLEQRLRETNAIGVFTKLSLKNQVDDLLDQFRGFYQGRVKVSLTELRQRYELLLLKVLSLLQDSDQGLAAAIAASRETIWEILADPQEFAGI